MAHIHDVIDSDTRFVIDPITRNIVNQGSQKLMLVKGDHKSERFTFEIPRYVEHHDMSLCNIIRIHYTNTDAKTRATSIDVYEPDDLSIDPKNKDLVKFSWLISRNATTYAGSLVFSIEFQCVVDDTIEYAWNTCINRTITISDGINNGQSVVGSYSDLLTSWWLKFYGDSTLPIEIHTMESFAALNGETKEDTLYLLEDDPTLDELFQLNEPLKALAELTNDIAAIKTRLEEFDTYSQAILSIQEDLAALTARVLALENGEVVNPDNPDPEDPDDPDNPGGTDPDNPTNPDPEDPNPEDPEHQHAYTFIETVPATCTSTGYDLYECPCGSEDRRNSTAKLEHVWTYYQDPSAGETGWSRRCTLCNTIETDVVYGCTDGGDHTWVEDGVIAATCEEPGYQKYECSICGETKKEAITAPLGHNWSGPIYDALGYFEPTCDKAGLAGYICSVCSKEKQEIVPALGHKWIETGVTLATCTTPAYQNYECSVCGGTKSEVSGPVLQHDYEHVVTSPTCVNQGYTTHTCKHCGYSYKDNYVAATGEHNWGDPVDSGTGYVYVCDTCGATKSLTQDNCDHTDEVIDVKYADCDSGGYTVYKCSLCGREETRDYTAALGHNYASNVTDATCTAGGYTTYTCSRCDDTYTDNETPATGHKWSGWTTTIEPTCQKEGVETRTCSECGETESSPLEIGNHDTEYYPGKDATCTEDGYTSYNVCKICGEIVNGKHTIKADHDLSTSPAIEPTCTEYGRTALTTCSRCDYSSGGESIEPNGHSFPNGWVEHKAPTCTEAGVKRRYCVNCDYYEADPIPALGHDYESIEDSSQSSGYIGVCRVCGDTVEDYTP